MSEEPENKPHEADDAWIDKVANVAGHLGFNKTRLRWKLIRWQEKRRKDKNLREQKMLHVGYAHKTCAECGAIQDKDEVKCTACGAKLSSRGWQMLGRLGILSPVGLSISTLLALAILAVYARVWIAAGGGFGSPSVQLLVDFGGRWPPLVHDEPWRLLTACYLHAGLLHLVFNLVAIAIVGPRIEELYGRTTALGLFVITGVLANLGTLWVGPLAVGIGASGGVMGLIGVAAGWGQRAGRGRGYGLRDDMLKWSAYTFIFGFAAGADNWAHLFGLVTGFAFGFTVKAEMWRKRKLFVPLRVLIGLIGVAGTIAAIALVFTRHPTPLAESDIDPAFAEKHAWTTTVQVYTDVCVPYANGDSAGALAALTGSELAKDMQGFQPTADYVTEMCESALMLRDQCAEPSKFPAGSRKSWQDTCAQFADVFKALPARRSATPPAP